MTQRDLVNQGFEQSRVSVALILATIVAAVNVLSTVVMLALSG